MATGESADPDLDNIVAEVQADLDAGQGEKHFQDIFDSISSSQGSARVDEDPATRETLARFALSFSAGLNDRLRGNEHGFTCLSVNPDGYGRGFICKFRDKGGRPFTAECSYEDGFEAAARYGNADMGRGMMAKVIERLIASRETYFKRMEKMH